MGRAVVLLLDFRSVNSIQHIAIRYSYLAFFTTNYPIMKKFLAIISFVCIEVYMSSCNQTQSANEQTSSPSNNTELAEFINKIKAIDNHSHAKHDRSE
jgi:hypothetical protein